MYGLVPNFSNKIPPQLQYVSTDLLDVFKFMVDELKVTSDQFHQSLYEQSDDNSLCVGDGSTALYEYMMKEYNSDTTDCVLACVRVNNTDKQLYESKFYIQMPEYVKNTSLLIIKFEGSIKKAWDDDVLDMCF